MKTLLILCLTLYWSSACLAGTYAEVVSMQQAQAAQKVQANGALELAMSVQQAHDARLQQVKFAEAEMSCAWVVSDGPEDPDNENEDIDARIQYLFVLFLYHWALGTTDSFVWVDANGEEQPYYIERAPQYAFAAEVLDAVR
jgi:hypothetical protein